MTRSRSAKPGQLLRSEDPGLAFTRCYRSLSGTCRGETAGDRSFQWHARLLEVSRWLTGERWAEIDGGDKCPLSEGNRRVAAGAMSLLRARKVLAYVESNLSGTMLVGNLARIAGLSCAHFHRLFRRRFGVTPHKYITLRRIEISQSLMLTTDEPLIQISIACGMSDQAHFTRTFRRIVGESPGHWRSSRRARQ